MTTKLETLLIKGTHLIPKITATDFSLKPFKDKWSKKEILGHLIDSAIHNLQRFTEIQYCKTPYFIRPYKQQALIEANHYQSTDSTQLLQLWLSLNHQILHVIKNQNKETLAYNIEFESKKISNFKFLITDYIAHLEHHLNQITS